MNESSVAFFQVVIRDYTPQWLHINCTEDSIAEATATCLTTDKQNHFSLGQPNMRLALMETDTNKSMLVISWHHGILDAISWNLVLDDVHAVYNQQTRPKTYPYKHFIASLHSRTPAFIAGEKAYWKNRLSQLDVESFPKLEASNDESGMIRLPGFIEIPIQIITQFAQMNKVTIFTLLKAVWAMLLRKYTQSEEVVFGYTVSGRSSELEGVSSMIGPCINTLPCHVRYDGSATIGEWIQSIHSDYISSLSYQQSSLREIQGWAGISPLIDSLLDYKTDAASESVKTGIQSPDKTTNLQLIPLAGNERTEVCKQFMISWRLYIKNVFEPVINQLFSIH
ncbi:hypothetical protein K7432_018170 [Basidiobolus ranarum]|uniref:Condensation domain-containing protein n=1 Tax=Basidiobolus ranarum TaxID=34480 RepID=A0ABR2VJN7_9FUNG